MIHNVLVTTESFSAEGFGDGLHVVYNPNKRRMTEKEVLDLAAKYKPVGILAGVEPLTRRVMSASGKLAVISRYGTGLDSVDLEAARELGITVRNTPEIPVEAVAELTLGLMLAALRHIPAMDASVRGGGWRGPSGRLLEGRTVGIIGCGRIGTRVAALAAAFGCGVIGYDPGIGAHPAIPLTDLPRLLADSDIVTLHIPLTPETQGILSGDALAAMKPGAVLINASRGGLVDEDALYEALTRNKLSAAALDCFGQEPYRGKLIALPNVVLSPHMGSDTGETRVRMERRALDNLLEELIKRGVIPAPGQVNKDNAG